MPVEIKMLYKLPRVWLLPKKSRLTPLKDKQFAIEKTAEIWKLKKLLTMDNIENSFLILIG